MNLLIHFPDQSESFSYGVEFGRLLEKMERGEEVINNNGFPIRIENLDLIKNSCELYNYTATFGKPYLDGWVDFLGIKKTFTPN